VDADAVPEAGRDAGREDHLVEGYEVDRLAENEASYAEGDEAGHKKDSDEGGQIDLEAKTPPEPSPPPEPPQPEPPADEPQSS
jgi:hypothetical protein